MSKGKEITKVEGRAIEQPIERPAVAPPVDIYENENEILVVADVPGVQPDGVRLSFENNELTIHASPLFATRSSTPIFREFPEVDFRRGFELAPGIDAERISAELREGTLRIHLPKSAAVKPRQIPVSVG